MNGPSWVVPRTGSYVHKHLVEWCNTITRRRPRDQNGAGS